jgi:2-polyprenyl-3-methyl-5-hydroxy-6-metoxy-1,4-benzoquinol methylase
VARTFSPRDAAIARIASRYEGRWLRGYVRGKLRGDPIYDAGLALLKDSPLPVLDVGCGIGLFACWLREHGCAMPIHGVDLDEGKIAQARRATARYADVSFEASDAASGQPPRGHVVVFDTLHLLSAPQQRALLERLAHELPDGACCLIRTTVRDGSWRFFATRVEDWWLRASRWMNSDARHYATIDEVCAPFRARGCAGEVRLLWVGTPFNSYLFILRRRATAASG